MSLDPSNPILIPRLVIREYTGSEWALSQNQGANSLDVLMSFFDDMTDTYYRTDSSGYVQFASKSVEGLLGYSVREAIGLKLADLYAQ